MITRKIDELSRLGVETKMIAPSHGVIWRSDPDRIVNSYLEWSRGVTQKKAVITYNTMWGSTQRMAYAISDALRRPGIEVRLFHMRRSDFSEITREILDAKAVIVGSPALNNSMFPTVNAFLTHIIGLRPKGKVWASFGSYEWGGRAVRHINRLLKKFRFKVLEPSLSIRYAPSREELKYGEFGERIAEKIK